MRAESANDGVLPFRFHHGIHKAFTYISVKSRWKKMPFSLLECSVAHTRGGTLCPVDLFRQNPQYPTNFDTLNHMSNFSKTSEHTAKYAVSLTAPESSVKSLYLLQTFQHYFKQINLSFRIKLM
eukprot:sb/3475733/